MCCTIRIGSGERRPGSAARSPTARSGPPVETPIATTFGATCGRNAGTAPAAARSVAAGPAAAAAAGVAGSVLAQEELVDARDQFAPQRRPCDSRHLADVGGLGDVVVGAEHQRVERRGRAALRQRAEHDHRMSLVLLADPPQRLEPVHLGHLDVERDDVGIDLRDPLQRDRRRWRRPRRPRCRDPRPAPGSRAGGSPPSRPRPGRGSSRSTRSLVGVGWPRSVRSTAARPAGAACPR